MATGKYPKNWKMLALSIKIQSDYLCKICDKQCYRPGEIPKDQPRSYWTGNVLQVHHRNFDRSDNRLSNLIPICSECHLRIHATSKYSDVSEGQLSLF